MQINVKKKMYCDVRIQHTNNKEKKYGRPNSCDN